MKKIEWVPESEAASLLGYRGVRRFRTLVKEGKIPVPYTNCFGRSYQYDRAALEIFRLRNSSSFNSNT